MGWVYLVSPSAAKPFELDGAFQSFDEATDKRNQRKKSDRANQHEQKTHDATSFFCKIVFFQTYYSTWKGVCQQAFVDETLTGTVKFDERPCYDRLRRV